MRLKGWRTLIVNGAVAAAGVLALLADLLANANIPPGASVTAIVLALVNAYWRIKTDTPVGKSA